MTGQKDANGFCLGQILGLFVAPAAASVTMQLSLAAPLGPKA